MRKLILSLLRLYQVAISPLLGPHCRYYPTCSNYARIAVQRHGAARGSYLAFRRVLRCHPWHPGGVDLVPEVEPPTSDPLRGPGRRRHG